MRSRSRRLAALVFCIGLAVCAAARAQQAPSAGVLDLVRGEALTFRVSGEAYSRLTRVDAVQALRDREAVSRTVTARLAPNDAKGRWVEVTASTDAAPGAYRLDGFAGSTRATVFPIVVNVVADRREARQLGLAPAVPLFPNAAMRVTAEEARVNAARYDPGTVNLVARLAAVGAKADARIPGLASVADRAQLPSAETVELITEPAKEAPSLSPPPPLETSPAVRVFDRFDADATSRSWQRAYLLSLLSWVAYFPAANAAPLLSSWGLEVGSQDFFDIDTVYFIGNSGSTQGFVAHNAEAIFVAFQGSTDASFAQDWFDNDLDANPEPVPQWALNVIMHHGFSEATRLALPTVQSRVESLLKDGPGRKVWLTGHSLGGAVAVISAFRLQHEANIDVHGVYTYGAPPVGNWGWRQLFDAEMDNVHRWNLENDPVVSLLPPLAFEHVGINNNLYANLSHPTAQHGWSDPLIFAYPISTASVAQISQHFQVTHMAYWCRLRTEVEAHASDQAHLYPEPPSNTTPGCMDD